MVCQLPTIEPFKNASADIRYEGVIVQCRLILGILKGANVPLYDRDKTLDRFICTSNSAIVWHGSRECSAVSIADDASLFVILFDSAATLGDTRPHPIITVGRSSEGCGSDDDLVALACKQLN